MQILSSLSQQAHEDAGGVGVQAERRHGDVGGGVGPVLVVVLHPVQHGVGGGGFPMHHLTCNQIQQSRAEKSIQIHRGISNSLEEVTCYSRWCCRDGASCFCLLKTVSKRLSQFGSKVDLVGI